MINDEVNVNQDDIGYNNVLEEQQNEVVINDVSEVPDITINDLISSIGTVTSEAEKTMAQEDPELARDAVVAKTVINNKAIADENGNATETISKMLPRDNSGINNFGDSNSIPGLDKPLDFKDQQSIIEECFPCLDRPEISSGFKSAVSQIFSMYFQMFDMIASLPKLVSAISAPANAYSFVCSLLNAFRAICIPDLERMLTLIEYYLSRLFLYQLRKFTFILDINMDIVFIPFYAGLMKLITVVIDEILKPVQCIIYSFDTQAKKIPGAYEEIQKLKGSNKFDNPFAALTYISEKLQEALNDATMNLYTAIHDWQAYMCKIGLQIKQVLYLIEQIDEFLQMYSVIKALINIKQTSERCDDPNAPNKYATSILKDVFNVEVNDNGDIYEKPPIILDNKEDEILDDIITTFDKVHKEDTTVRMPSGNIVSYTHIKNMITNMYNNNDNITQGIANIGSTVTLSYNESIKNIDTLNEFKQKYNVNNLYTGNVNNNDSLDYNIQNGYVIIGNVSANCRE